MFSPVPPGPDAGDLARGRPRHLLVFLCAGAEPQGATHPV